MRFIVALTLVSYSLLNVECHLLPVNLVAVAEKEETDGTILGTKENQYEFKKQDDIDQIDNVYEFDRKPIAEQKKPCTIVVLSNAQNPNMQSLMRRYKYDAKGVLIPSSVRYFIKLPQGISSSPLLIPLNDKAFSPLGGFVRYYKEVPPIPQSWLPGRDCISAMRPPVLIDFTRLFC